MDLFGMGMGEIILVLIVAMIIWGPNKIPEIARTAGKFVNTLKKTSSELTAQITKEIDEAEQGKREHLPPSAANQIQKTVEVLPPDPLVLNQTQSTGEGFPLSPSASKAQKPLGISSPVPQESNTTGED